jgi:hypothetical protein
MRTIALVSIFFAYAHLASGHTPVLVEFESLKDIITIDDPELSRAYYGELKGFPHTYEVRSDAPFLLRVEVLVPDTDWSTNGISSMIVRQVEGSGRVTEVARLEAKDASWESFYEPWGGDSYRRGPMFEEELLSGTYRVEIHTPDNIEKYVLVIGSREERELGYFELLGRIVEVKTFFGKSKVAILQSPIAYIPFLIALVTILVLMYVWRFRRRRDRINM